MMWYNFFFKTFFEGIKRFMFNSKVWRLEILIFFDLQIWKLEVKNSSS